MATRQDREADVWLSDEQLAKCTRADEADDLHSPIPTQMVSNGEHMPIPQTEDQKRVEARIKELADFAAKKLNVSRRQFLATTGGMAAGFLAMNEVYGRFFDADEAELFEPEARAKHGPPSDLFVLDDQLHMVRSSMVGPQFFRAFAQWPTAAATSNFKTNPFQPPGQLDELGKAWQVLNPQLVGAEINDSIFHLMHFVKDVFFDSQTTVGLLSNATLGVFPPGDPNARPPKNVTEGQAAASLTAAQTAAVRTFVNKLSGSRRMLAHGQIYPGVPNLDFMEKQIHENHPDSWKGYTVATSAKVDFDPDSLMRMWRLDDEKIAYPTYRLIASHGEQLANHPGFFNICIHKGFSPAPLDTPEMGNPTDVPKAARDWPMFNFIIYHACFGGMTPFLWPAPGLSNIRNGVLRNGVPDITWTTQFAQTCGHIRNVYAEIGSTFGGIVITFPTVCAHILGQLLKYFGENKIVFGSDCVYYGSPQWQIEAMWRFEIPDSIRHQYGYPELTKSAKRKILGLNSARLYKLSREADISRHGVYRPIPRDYDTRVPMKLKTLLEFPGLAGDALARARSDYLAGGAEPSHTRYGWVRTSV
jgi:predicted TIM-barrel fold metal-dependent hydrolase